MAFKKGQSGNPKGRPRGGADKRLKYREMLQSHAEDLIQAVVDKALEGDTAAQRMCLERIVPAMKSQSAPIKIKLTGDLAEKGAQVLEAVGSGKLSPDEGSSVMSSLQGQAKLIESEELIERIERLEEASAQRK